MKKNIVCIILFVLSTNFLIAQVGTNGDDRKEEGRPIKEYNLTIEQNEITATAQDGSGHTSIQLGKGDLVPATVIDRPDKIAMMQQMAKMDMKMGAPSIISNPKKKDPLLNEAGPGQ